MFRFLILLLVLIWPTASGAEYPEQRPLNRAEQRLAKMREADVPPPYEQELRFNVVERPGTNDGYEYDAAPPPIPNYISNRQVTFTPQEREALRLAKEWRASAISPHMALQGGKIVFAYGVSVPTLVCAPLRISDLELQQGEMVNDVVIGDSARWQTDIVHVGANGMSTPHIIFKPLDASLETSVLITTNRRAYHLTLKSDREQYTPFAGFVYPQDIQIRLASARAKVEQKQEHLRNEEGVDISNLDFGYEISGKARWRPIQVFNDGVKTYIKMPQSISRGEMPVLLVETASGQALVNYRIRNNTFVVDQLFDEAFLIVGVGSDQEKVTIEWEKS